MKKKTRNLIIIVLILAVLFSVYYFNFYKGQITKYTLVDICFSYYPENFGNYPYTQGFWNTANQQTLTISVDGRIKNQYWVYNKREVTSDVGVGNAIRVFYKTCNLEGECFEGNQILYAFDYDNEYNNCINDCYKYGYPGQCKYYSKTPISYSCDFICMYQGDTSFSLNMIKPSKSYTITITKVQRSYQGQWLDVGSDKYPQIVYSIFYDPNDKPWEMICNPGEKKNFRCDSNYKTWDECSQDGKSWFVNKEFCNFGCLNGECVSQPLQPPKPQPIWDVIINKILDWLKSLFSFFKFEIYGETYPVVGSQQNYIINITTTKPDKDYSDGTYQVQYASWILVDGSGNIINKGEWEEVDGSYYKQITLTIPPNPGNYVLVGVIYQYDMKYNPTTLKWDIINEGVVAKEALNLNAKLIQPPKPPMPDLFAILKNIWCWILSLFGFRC
jgi:hypothetical protein